MAPRCTPNAYCKSCADHVRGGWIHLEQDLRSALRRYDDAGQLLRIRAPISWNFEAAAVLWAVKSGPAVVLENVTDYEMPIVGNVLNERAKLAVACGIPLEDLQTYLLRAYHTPIPPDVVSTPSCQQVLKRDAINLLTSLPVPMISEHDAGRFITAGLLICRDPVTSRTNVAISRLQVKGPDRLGCFLADGADTRRFLAEYQRLGKPMEVAVAIGNHPILMAASQMSPPDDELLFAGGLFGAPTQMAHCVSLDLDVPAHAEVVLEGTIDPSESEPEGPFGEFGGQYNASGASPVIRIHAMTTRTDPLFQMIVGGTHPEHSVTGVFSREVRLFEAVRRVVPGVKQVAFTLGGTCRFHAIVSINQKSQGEARLAIMAALSSSILIRQVIVVDDDIDIFDKDDVEWALASRLDASRDVVIIEGCTANPRDPGARDGVATKIGFDATLRADAPKTDRLRPDVPLSVRQEVSRRLARMHAPK